LRMRTSYEQTAEIYAAFPPPETLGPSGTMRPLVML
jgi:hypothetical protein